MNMLPYSGFPALPKNIEDMHAQLVALGLNDVEALTARIKKCEDWVDTVEETEQTGNPVEFQNALALPAKSLTVNLEPDQDLHGQSAPYVGGAGKNKLPMAVSAIKAANTSGTWSGNVYTINGGTITILTDSDGNITGFKVNGTFNAQMTFYLLANYGTLSDMFGSGNFVLSQGVAFNFTDPTGIMLQKQEAGANIYIQIGATEVAFTSPDANHYRPIIRFQSGNTLDNAVIQPMVRVSTESSAFAPYTNICPISGRTSVTITDVDAESQTATVTVQLGQTVYGGSLNLTTGVMSITNVITDLGDYTWTYHDTLYQFYAYFPSDSPNNIIGGRDGISSAYAVAHNTTIDALKEGELTMFNSVYGSGKTMWIKDSRYSDATQFKTAVTGYKLVYPLATPTTIQLTPTEVQMLKGYNLLSSDGGGDITVTAYTGGPWEAITRALKK